MIEAPFTDEQVAALNQFQCAGHMHPFTCPGNRDCSDRDLIATTDGWVCPCGAYKQSWAHKFMLVEPVNPLEPLNTQSEEGSVPRRVRKLADRIVQMHWRARWHFDSDGLTVVYPDGLRLRFEI